MLKTFRASLRLWSKKLCRVTPGMPVTSTLKYPPVRCVFGLVLVTLLGVTARAQSNIKAFTNNIDYNAGSAVQLKIVDASSGALLPSSIEVKATIRYAGDKNLLRNQVAPGRASASPEGAHQSGYHLLWQIPSDARTGRYLVDLVGVDTKSHHQVFSLEGAASFVVYRKLVHVEFLKLDKTFYTSGDPVSAEFTIANVSHRTLSGLRVEFSNRYWPWIAGPADAAKASVVTIEPNLNLPAGGKKTFHAAGVETADNVKQPSTRQYGVVVWDHARKTVLDISFSPLAIVQPPGITEPKPFSGWYMYPTLNAVNTESYRRFYPVGLESPAIQFDRSHTMFPTGGKVEAKFTVKNPTVETWKGISIRTRVIDPSGNQLSQETEAGPIDLGPEASYSQLHTSFPTALDAAGLYLVKAEVLSATGSVLATETLELGVNPLPKSILIFCAHEDDEGGYSGLTRAAIENHIPIHYVYFTSGDAGSCDVYYQHSCSPADALNFGAIRMDEVRASLGHLGVPREDILFIGLPDGGSGMIWYDHLKPTDPFLDPLLATDHAPYEGLIEPNLPYAREAVVETAKGLIKKFQPEIIATPHPGSVGHIDHIVNNYFVVKALESLAREGAVPANLPVLVNPVRDPNTQPYTPYHYQNDVFFISGDVAALAQEARWFYMSQGGSRAEGGITPYDKLPRSETFRQLLDWNEHEGWNDKRAATNP